MTRKLAFALNHIATPRLRFAAFLDLARALGIDQVEIRNFRASRSPTAPTLTVAATLRLAAWKS